MSNIDSPAVARRRVRLALRAARLAKKLTQSQVARAMDWSLSKVIRIEKGEVNVSPSDLKVLLEHLDVTDPGTVEGLLDDVRLSRSERWTVSTDDREHMTPAMIELVQFESEASTVRYYNHLVVPGVLQTRAYAEAIFANYPTDFDPGTVEARVALRERRRGLISRKNGPEYLVLLDESVLMRVLGNSRAMAEQIELLLRLVSETKTQIRVLPLAGVTKLFFLGPFTIVDLEEGQSTLFYRETAGGGDEVVHDPADVERHRRTFDQMWALALSREETAETLARQARKFRAEDA
ncbi:MAG TPA: helix-turn-helix transcriptional regulator [Mycobacterium sp.]|jgi:Helix-turn-helix.|nr:helix-turn-helix transcriptional regulator [Mycobacterium sp.]